MGKQRSAGMSSFWEELIQVGVYKRNQGRVTRQVTMATLTIIAVLGTMSLYRFDIIWSDSMRYGVAGTVLLGGLWLSFRFVNYPRFADFLIAVEAEMNKVSWPSKKELIRSSLVVLFCILALTTVLFFFDIFWQMAFIKIGILSK